MYLGQRTKATLRMQTVRRIASASYPHLEQCGAARPLGVLTQDLDTIVVFFISLPSIAIARRGDCRLPSSTSACSRCRSCWLHW